MEARQISKNFADRMVWRKFIKILDKIQRNFIALWYIHGMSGIWPFLKDFLINSIADPDEASLTWQPKKLEEYLAINQDLSGTHISAQKISRCTLYSPWGNNIYSILPYQNPIIKEFIHELKFKGNDAATKLSAEILLLGIEEAVQIHRLNWAIVVPLLASYARRREKGFDQCLNIANELNKFTHEKNIETVQLLKRKGSLWGKAAQQHALARRDRFKNSKSGFYVDREVFNKNIARHIENPAPDRKIGIIIFDDVVTTGATLHSSIMTIRVSLGTLKIPILGLALAH